MNKSLITIFVALFLSATFIQAQEAVLPQLANTNQNIDGDFMTSAPSGAIVDRFDGTHILILENADLMTQWTVDGVPSLDMPEQNGSIDTTTYSRAWRGIPRLKNTGILQFNDVTLHVTLESPLLNLDTGTLTFTATINEVLEPQNTNLDDISLNRRFDQAQVQVDINPEFLSAIHEGMEVARDNERDCVCPSGMQGLICEICQSGV